MVRGAPGNAMTLVARAHRLLDEARTPLQAVLQGDIQLEPMDRRDVSSCESCLAGFDLVNQGRWLQHGSTPEYARVRQRIRTPPWPA